MDRLDCMIVYWAILSVNLAVAQELQLVTHRDRVQSNSHLSCQEVPVCDLRPSVNLHPAFIWDQSSRNSSSDRIVRDTLTVWVTVTILAVLGLSGILWLSGLLWQGGPRLLLWSKRAVPAILTIELLWPCLTNCGLRRQCWTWVLWPMHTHWTRPGLLSSPASS